MRRPKKKRRSGFIVLKVIFILLLVSGAAAAFIVNFCQTKDVLVKGNVLADTSEVQEAVLNNEYDTNAVFATVRNLFMNNVTIPFVEKYQVSMKNLNTIVIKVTEKELSGYLFNDKGDKYVYYGPDGIVQEVSDRFIKGIFFVEGLVAKDAKAGEPLPINETDIKTILLIRGELEREKLKVKTIRFTKDGIITFKVKNVLVNLGTRARAAEKVRRAQYILPKLKGEKGTLHLEEWSEENTDVIFEKGE